MRYSYVPESDAAHEAYNPWAVPLEQFPAPLVTSRESMALTFPLPAACASLAEFAREQGWEVRMQYAQGYSPHGTTGRPGALKDSIALRFGAHPLTERQAYAVYERTASGGAWGWSTMIWGPDLPPYAGCGVEQLRTYLATPGMFAHDLKSWVAQIKDLRAAQAAASKARTKTAAPKAREGMQ